MHQEQAGAVSARGQAHLSVTSVPIVNTVGPFSAPGSTSSTSVVRGRAAELRSHHLVTCVHTAPAPAAAGE